uniref:Stereocilin LRR domain-containing protein n=1 Tax=Poecilia mexicana TaxID=48701 RepID=A0A3B3YC65_9TELE
GEKVDHRDALLKEIVSKWSKEAGLRSPPETNKDQSLPSWVRSIMGGLKTLFPSKNLPSLNKPIDRHRLSGFLYNISLYLQEMGAELEDEPAEQDEDQLWEKVLHFFLQSEGNAALNQWNGRVPPRPSVKVQDWFLSLRGSPHWDWLLGLLQSLITLSERQPHRPILAFLSQNWRTVSAVLEATLQAVISGTYGQASAGLQGFICALKGRSDCAFGVSWLQQLLQFLETRNWKPVVSLHPAGEPAGYSKGPGAFGRFKPFSLPPEAMLRQDGFSANASAEDMMSTEDELDSVQSFLLQALSRSGGGDRGGQQAQKNLALVQSLDGLRRGLLHRVGSSVYGSLREKVSRVTMAILDDVSSVVEVPQPNFQGRCSVNLRQLILGIRHNVMWNAQALGAGSQGLPSSLPFLSCPSTQEEKLQPPPLPAQSSSKKTPSSQKPFRQTQSREPSAAGPRQFTESNRKQRQMEFFTSTEILEAACNDSIPGLTGVSNFTVFLYCKLFEGETGSGNPAATHLGLDLHATCSDAAWYLSAAEEDFFWVHVCTEFFAHEFNNTVCANSSFWLQKAQQQAAALQDYHFFNQTSIDDLCMQLSRDAAVNPELSEDCLAQLGSRSLNAEAFRNCFLPNNSVLISALCGRDSPGSQQSLPEGSWAAAYCSKIDNLTFDDTFREPCQYMEWTVEKFTNFTLLELCGETQGLREHMCLNATLYKQLVGLIPQFADVCSDLRAQQESNKCLLQRIFDMLPARYEFDTSQLCVETAPMLIDLIHKLSVCEVDVGEREGFLVMLGYVLRVLDFVVGLSSGLDEGEREARQGLGQAILLSSLLDNTSWASLRPEASMSVLHTVGVFLRREQNATVKEDLLSCFSQPVLWDLIQQNGNSSALRVLLQEYLQMPKDSIRSLVMSAEKEAVKRFISHMHQSWDQLQVETSQASQQELQAMETMTAAFIHKFPRVTPELFVDLSQFIPFMSVSDIMNFPASLIVNDSLTAIRDHSSEMKSLQKKAFVKRLLQSNMVGDVPTWPPYFLSSILPLLPYLPVHHFQQLTSQQQLSPLVELIGNSSLDGVRGRHVLRTIFSRRKNLTGDDLLLGVLACYLDPAELGLYLQDPAVSSVLWQQLSQCISKGLISSSGRLSSWLIPAVSSRLNISSMTSSELSALSGLLPQLGASFLLSLTSQRLLEILSEPGFHTFSPAQDLGRVAAGMSCDFVRRLTNHTDFTELLQFLTDLPGGPRPALRKCLVDELRKQPELDLGSLSSGFAAVTMLENLSNASVRGILSHIQLHFLDFLRLPHYKQTNLAEKALSELGALLDVLGPLFPFLDRDSLALVDRGALALRLEEMRSFCLPKEALRDISDLLTQRDLLNPSKWQVGDVEHLGRLVFALSTKQINSIPLKTTVEQVLVGQKRWEKPVPSCADIRGTFPSAWTPTQLRRMSLDELKECVEVFGQDPSLGSEQRRSLWPVRELRADQVLALGSLLTEMGDRELQDTSLSDLGVLVHLGSLTNWTPRKMRAVVLSMLRKSGVKVEHLSVVDVATLGHLICGLNPTEMKRLSPYNLVAVLFLRETTLPCTEQQMEALTNCLARAEAFGPVSSWGPEIFTEIGTLAVVFSAVQLSWLSAEQAWAVTEEQWAELDAEQRHAVGLARYEGDVLMELR